jgi:ABC-type branched-subunit amino acid transport system substrate-binding protein
MFAAIRTALCTFAGLLIGFGIPLDAPAHDYVLGHISSVKNPASSTNARDLSMGYRVYFQHVNENGGLYGRKLTLLHLDDNLNAQRMVELTEELIANPDVIALVGYLNTGGLTEIAKQDLLKKHGIAMIAPLQGNQNIIGAENMFPFRSGYQEEMRALVTESLNTQKPRVAIVYMNAAFGPPSASYADRVAKESGLTVTANLGYEIAPDKMEESLKQVIKRVGDSKPDAVILLGAGKGAFDFVKGMRSSQAAQTQIYGLSVLQTNDLVKMAGVNAAHGVVLSQAVPFPYSGTLPLTREFQRMMKQYAPNEAVNFLSLEGYAGAKITVEALRRAGPNPSRQKVIDTLKSMGEFDLGGVSVRYNAKQRIGWRGIDLTIIGAGGRLVR